MESLESREGITLVPTSTRRRIKKMLSKGLTSHSGYDDNRWARPAHSVHVVNHSDYHRGQITTLLRQLGAEAASTDLLVYYDEKPKKIRMAR